MVLKAIVLLALSSFSIGIVAQEIDMAELCMKRGGTHDIPGRGCKCENGERRIDPLKWDCMGNRITEALRSPCDDSGGVFNLKEKVCKCPDGKAVFNGKPCGSFAIGWTCASGARKIERADDCKKLGEQQFAALACALRDVSCEMIGVASCAALSQDCRFLRRDGNCGEGFERIRVGDGQLSYQPSAPDTASAPTSDFCKRSPRGKKGTPPQVASPVNNGA